MKHISTYITESLLGTEEEILGDTGSYEDSIIKNEFKSMFFVNGTYTVSEEYIDVKGDLIVNKRYRNKDRNLKAENFIIKHVSGDYVCSDCKLKSLEGSPEIVDGRFVIDKCHDLINFTGAPRKVKSIECWKCKNLTSLEGLENIDIAENLCCEDCGIESLKGSPRYIKGDFNCSYCKYLKTLEGGPDTVDGSFICEWCPSLIYIEDMPTYIGGNFNCKNGCPGSDFLYELYNNKMIKPADKWYKKGTKITIKGKIIDGTHWGPFKED